MALALVQEQPVFVAGSPLGRLGHVGHDPEHELDAEIFHDPQPGHGNPVQDQEPQEEFRAGKKAPGRRQLSQGNQSLT